jgi:pyruvate kinase
MVTLAPEAAQSLESVQHLVDAGMDIARINCAHDSPADWKAMAQRVRQAGKAAGREVRILMDLGGPKIRTGAVMPRSAVLKLRPQRDEYGRVVHPSRLRLFAGADVCDARGVEPSMQVDAKWLSGLSVGTQVYFADARGAKRHLLIVETSERGAVAETLQTAYITPQTELTLHGNSGKKKATTRPMQMQVLPGILHLHIGDRLRLTREGAGRNAIGIDTDSDAREDVAHISCTLSQVIDQARTGERIWFDDGKIGGVIVDTKPHWLEVEITHAREGGEKLAADKGINLPDSVLSLPALTERDIENLKTVVTQADLVGLSFVRNPQDIDLLRHNLKELKCPNLGIVLKIETPQAFENLPALMFSAMGGSSAGVMIARGDLAVECGYERLAEVQEEILWCAEAAHMPVIWATQVLETMAKTGIPSRAEVSDASLGVRAECVMLNKGPYIVDAIRTLDDILLRMGGHQAKKRPLLRALHAWSNAIGSPDFPVTEMAPKTRKKSLRQSR